MNIAELKKLAGIDSEQKHETQQNVSHTATALKQKERQLGLKPGDREWFKLWFRRPIYARSHTSFRGRKK